MSGLKLQRLGMMMEPQPGNLHEGEGVLNPAAVRGPDGELYLFPRMVARGNYSRIGIARVKFNEKGDPTGVERLGVVLQPEADYELRPDGGGGCEDPRITFVLPLRRYLMAYAAYSSQGPRIALAASEDLFHWKRLGLAKFGPCQGVDFAGVDDKDASLFPVAVPNPSGNKELALIHRPLFDGSRPEQTALQTGPRTVDPDRESMWISYCPVNAEPSVNGELGAFTSHHRLATPVEPWERLKIGGGTPPVLTRHGWMIVYNGVSEVVGAGTGAKHPLCYSAGVMVLSRQHPQIIRCRSVEPVLTPTLPQERDGTVANVVFPTGVDRRDDIGQPDRFDIYYGMADRRIGAARLDMPETLLQGGCADSPQAMV